MSGGGKGAKTPKAPDYTALAQQQGQINRDTAAELTTANRPNQYDPFGNSITWSTGPVTHEERAAEYQKLLKEYQGYIDAGNKNSEASQVLAKMAAGGDYGLTGRQQQVQTLNPETKAAWENYMRNANQAASSYGGILNNYLNKYRQEDQTGQGLYQVTMDRVNKQQGRDTDALASQLRGQGLVPGSEAYNRAMQNLLTSQNDSNALTAQNTAISARNQNLSELAGISGIAGGQPYTPTYSGFSGATGYNPTDLVGAAQAQYGAKQAGANASNSKKGGLLGAGASLGGSYLGSK